MPEHRPRAREMGVRIGSHDTGEHNAITDVPGVRVGHTTLIEGDGPLVIGSGPVRTGVTAVLPHPGNLIREPVEAAHYVFNGAGTTAGLSLIDEFGQIETPVVLTNTFSVGAAYDAVTRYMFRTAFNEGENPRWFSPTVGETYDGGLNDAAGLHVREEHVVAAIETASAGPVAEGSVGAGTGTSCCGYKGGIGVSSRAIRVGDASHTVGALVQSNFGGDLVVDGVPVGRLLAQEAAADQDPGSIMVVIATDAPLTSRQLYRVAKRGSFGLARAGSSGGHGSGDYFIAFSTTYRASLAANDAAVVAAVSRREQLLDPLFAATADAVEEATLNSAFASDTMVGRDGNTLAGLPLGSVRELLARHGRI